MRNSSFWKVVDRHLFPKQCFFAKNFKKMWYFANFTLQYLKTSNSSWFHCADKETDWKVIKRLGIESQKRKVYRVSVKCFFNFVENKILHKKKKKKKIVENRGWNESKGQKWNWNYSFLGKCASFRASSTILGALGENFKWIFFFLTLKSKFVQIKINLLHGSIN